MKKFITQEKTSLQKKFKISIEYLENRNEKTLLNSNNHINSRIFISYYINNVRLIDNF